MNMFPQLLHTPQWPAPSQGSNHCNVLPRALPWAGMNSSFRAKKNAPFFRMRPFAVPTIGACLLKAQKITIVRKWPRMKNYE